MNYMRPVRYRTRIVAAAVAVSAGLVVTACSSDEKSDASTSSPAASSSASTQAAADLPTAADLNDILNRAVDPALPADQKAETVEDGDQATELFDVMTRKKEETGATFQVLDPVLPGQAVDSAEAPVTITLPNQQPTTADKVGFVKQAGKWKLSRQWACTFIGQVAPDQVPALCSGDGSAAASAPASETAPASDANVPAPEASPADPAAAAPADPVAAPADPAAQGGDPAIREALLGAGVDQATADKLAANPAATVAAAERMGVDPATAQQFASNPQGAIDALRAAGMDPVTAAPMLAAQL